MAHFKKIKTTLSIAATILLEACSSTVSDPAPTPSPIANIKAPELVGIWDTGCIATSVSGTATVTQASGGGTGGISGGEAYRITAAFNQDGRVVFTSENYSTSNCNANTLSGYGVYNAVYFVGEAGFANDGSVVTEYSYSDASSTTYSIFQIVGNSSLYLGDEANSSTGNNGDSEASRIDGLGVQFVKQ